MCSSSIVCMHEQRERQYIVPAKGSLNLNKSWLICFLDSCHVIGLDIVSRTPS